MRGQPLRLNFRKLRLAIAFLCVIAICQAQETITIIDQDSGEPLIGASVYHSKSDSGQTSNERGKVLILEAFKSDSIEVSYLGYETVNSTYKNLEENNWVLALKPSQSILDEVVLVYRSVDFKSDILSPLTQIDAVDIEVLQVQTPADLLEKTGGVFVQKSQQGGGSPVLRGFEANKVLLVVDGVRLNNAIYRSGHLQSSITIDEQVLESVDVLFGPGSIAFGSDALGGVIHYKSRNPKFSQEVAHKGELVTRFSTANQEKTIHGNYQYSSSRVSAILGITYSDFGDLRSGSNFSKQFPDFGKRFDFVPASIEPGTSLESELVLNDDPTLQLGSGYSQGDFIGKLKFRANDKLSFTLNTQYSSSTNIPRYDNLTERTETGLRFAEWYIGPQRRSLVSLSGNLKADNPLFDELYAIVSHQYIFEERVSRLFGSTFREENRENLSVYGLTLDFNKNLLNKYSLVYGLDIQHNDLNSTASPNTFTRYPNGGNTMTLYGLYAKVGIPLIKTDAYSLTWQNGARVSLTDMRLGFVRDGFFEFPDYFFDEGIRNETSNFSFLSSLNYRKEKLNLNIIGGTAFRAPNIDDIAKTRVQVDEITVPNPNVVPEKTTNLEIQASIGDETNFIGGTAYAVRLRDAIVRQAFTLTDGSPIFISGGDTLNVTAQVNAERALVLGFGLRGGLNIGKFGLKSSINLTKGRIEEDNNQTSPLGHIPPLYGITTLSYKQEKLSHEFNVRYNGQKDISEFGGSVDNPELATPIGSLSWYTLNYYGNYSLNEHFSFQFGVENILDRHYRTFSSGLSAPGRNFVLTLKGKI